MRGELALESAVLDEATLHTAAEAAAHRFITFRGPRWQKIRRLSRLDVWAAVTLTLAVAGARLFLLHWVNFCGTPDSCFYLGLAQGLERTGHFQVNFLYDLLLPKLQLPSTGIDYWRPGTSFFLLPAHWFGGVSLHSSATVATFAGVLWSAAAWRVARRTPGMEKLALPCYVLALLLPPAWIGSLSPDSTLFYAAAVAWFLALFTVKRQGFAQDCVALGCVAVAYLIRNDAVLLLVPLVAVLLLRRRMSQGVRSQEVQGPPVWHTSASYATLTLGGFLLALLPMHLIYRAVLGHAFPGGSAQALLLNDLGDFNLYGAPPSMAGLLARGMGYLLEQRASTLLLIVYRVAAVLLGYTALVFLPGLFARRRSVTHRPLATSNTASGSQTEEPPALPELSGPAAFAAAALAVYSFVLPAIGVFSALRTLVGVLPWVAVLVIAGVYRAVKEPWIATRICRALLVVYAVGGVMEDRRQIDDMNATGARDHEMARQLEASGARRESSLVMVGDPVQFSVTTGFAAVPCAR